MYFRIYSQSSLNGRGTSFIVDSMYRDSADQRHSKTYRRLWLTTLNTLTRINLPFTWYPTRSGSYIMSYIQDTIVQIN